MELRWWDETEGSRCSPPLRMRCASALLRPPQRRSRPESSTSFLGYLSVTYSVSAPFSPGKRQRRDFSQGQKVKGHR